ncbi:MAG: VCBS repeat-containing protein, partial [Bacteroidetes bacterium]|nr:VCBS repeat-containing protein [Bacteroidota bacterium]
MYNTKILLVSILILLSFSSCKKDNKDGSIINTKSTKTSTNTPTSNFIKVDSKKSGITFSNDIVHDLASKANLFDYDFFYNGAGVGIEDINNDGLKDIFFTGNQVQNKLYLNKGNLVFEDITVSANINTNKNWSNGVTFLDINNDGWMDIYVSQGGPNNKEERKNLLFVNQKNLTFKEEASNYGLDDTGISTQSAFFDFDKDGDLDCIVMNENDFYGVDPATFYAILKDKDVLKDNSSHLYENISGKFRDITEKAGLLRPTFGLGLCVSDINNDNWLDIYIANDYYVPDALYINNKNGTFSEEIKTFTNQVSFYGMGLDIADINNDNLKDILVLDMASSNHIRSKTLMASMNVPKYNLLINTLDLQYQYMYNSLQLNMGNNKFHNISQLTGMSKTDWSWAALIFDTDNDENEDVYVTNGYRKYGSDNDIRIKIAKAKQQYRGKVPLAVKEDLYNSLPSEKLANILFKNKGDLTFENVTSLSDLNEPSFSNGAAYSDLDNDGDLDIVVNNMDDPAFLFKNMSIENGIGNYIKIITKGALSEDFAKVSISYNGKTKTKESKRVRGYRSAVDNTIHFGLGSTSTIDTVKVVWTSGKQIVHYNIKANATLSFDEKNAQKNTLDNSSKNNVWFTKTSNSLNFTHTENEFDDFNKEILLPYKQSTLGPSITKGDVNGDGKNDIYIGGALGQAGELFLQTSKGFIKANNPVFKTDAHYEDMEGLFIDIDNDQDNDLYVVSGGSEFNERSESLKDRIYINDGKGNFSRQTGTEIDLYTISGKTVTKIDYDKDGDYDLIVGNRIKPQKYPLHEPSLIYENNDGNFTNVTGNIAPDFEDFGIVNKVIATDFNNDGWEDFIAVGEWTHIGLFLNENGTFTDISGNSKLDTENGWWNDVIETDVNNDGLKDYLIGNVGLNIKFKVSPKKPLRVYADDFDSNGTHDVVLSYKYNGVFVPARGKECSTQQMPFIAQKIPTYNEFANSNLVDIYGENILNAYQREANQFKSILILNEGNGKFKKVVLPNMAQTIPILDSDTYDFNKDGYEDIIVVGNIYNTEVETP